MQILAKKIFQGDVFVGNCDGDPQAFECKNFTDSPKTAWLIRRPNSELEYAIEFRNPNDADAIKGVWINMAGMGMLIDGELSDVVAKCALCCDATAQETTITPIYNGIFPDFSNPVQKEITITRVDTGSMTAAQDALYAYNRYVIYNSFYRSSRNNNTGVTTYKFNAFTVPFPQGADTVTQTPLVFTSAVAPAPGGNGLHAEIYANGNRIATGKTAATLSALVTALNGDAAFSTYGTFGQSNGSLTLSTIKADYVQFNITAVA